MIILGDPQITKATVTATNIGASIFSKKLQTFELADNMRVDNNSTVINIDFGAPGSGPIDFVGLCGTNLSELATIVLSYSDTDISNPDSQIVLPKYSEFNQIFTLATAIKKRYWRISITDTGNSALWIGYLYLGESIKLDTIYPHTPQKNMVSKSAVTATGQEYGSKRYNFYSAEWNAAIGYDDIDKFMDIVNTRQNIEPVIVVEFPESIDKRLYRPKYGVLTQSEYPFLMSENPLYYEVSIKFEERF